MNRIRTKAWRLTSVLLVALAAGRLGFAAPPTLRGRVVVGTEPVPGASVAATAGETPGGVAATAGAAPGGEGAKRTAVTAGDGTFSFSGLTAGQWTLRVTMTGFKAATQTVTVPSAQPVQVALTIADNSTVPELKMRPAKAMPPSAPGAANRAVAVNGSLDNGAASVYAQSPAFGNARPSMNRLFNGGIGLVFGNSALDARSYSLTGAPTPRPAYNDITGTFQFGGPLIIPHLTTLNNAPNFFVGYQRETSRNAVTTAALVPTVAERGGDLSAVGGPVIATGDLSPQALALLKLYPLPNITLPNLGGNGHFNYQAPVITSLHQDSLQTRLSRYLPGWGSIFGTFNVQSARTGTGSIFGFNDQEGTLGMNAALNWQHSFGRTFNALFTLNYSRMRTRLTPYFAGQEDIAGAAGIVGGDANPADWGPPALTFSSGWAGLSDGLPEDNRNQTMEFSSTLNWSHFDHNAAFGGGVSRLEFNEWKQTNPRGGFSFTGANTGNDLADFLKGLPDTASLDYGAADRYFRQLRSYLFATDDWRVSDSLTLDLGVRWEYEAPMTETQGRLANLAVGNNFTAATPVVSGSPLRPDRNGIEPRLGLAWEPFAASSMIVKAGYGVYYDTSVYTALAEAMARQAPLDRSLQVASTATTPLTLATALLTPAGATPTLLGVQPNFRIGYVQTWSLSVQRDLPANMAMVVSYLGNKGTHGVQRFLPNSYAPGGVNPCPACPVGFVYETSGGRSTYEAGKAELQRRFSAGVAATLTYTYANAMDNASVGGASHSAQFLAQDWQDLNAGWARSSFDQRHSLTLTAQYSTGSRLPGGMWLHGWTLTTQVTAGSGLPLTPLVPAVIGGTGYTGIRPDVTGVAVAQAGPGAHLDAAAFAVPPAGSWGNAGRDSITGPAQFGMDASAQRTFPVRGRMTALFRLDANNVLNHVSFPSWDTTVGSAQFGWPLTANAMRTVRATLRLSF